VNLPAGLDIKNIGSFYWRPDSAGLFFDYKDTGENSPARLYYLDLANGGPILADTLAASVPENYFWVGSSR